MQALKSGHTAHHCGDVAQHRVGPHAEDTPRLYARRLRGRVFKRSPRNFRCDPALSKNYLPFGELFADGFLVRPRWPRMCTCPFSPRRAREVPWPR